MAYHLPRRGRDETKERPVTKKGDTHGAGEDEELGVADELETSLLEDAELEVGVIGDNGMDGSEIVEPGLKDDRGESGVRDSEGVSDGELREGVDDDVDEDDRD